MHDPISIFNWILLLPLIAVLLQLVCWGLKTQYQQLLQAALLASWLLLSLLLNINVDGVTVTNLGNWPAPFAISLAIDHLDAIMLLVFGISASCIFIFSVKDPQLHGRNNSFNLGCWLLILGATGAIATTDLFNLYVWLELMLLSAFILLACTNKIDAKAIARYAVNNIAGTLFFLLGIGLIYGTTGALNYAAIAQYIQQHNSIVISVSLVILLFAIALKGGLFPFYFWLPSAYPEPSCSSTMLLSSLMTKTVMLILLRLIWWWTPLQHGLLHYLLIGSALATMLFGVLGAASNNRCRDILSFHIISQLGYIALAIIIPSAIAIMAAVYFIIHNIFVKTALFMSTGIVEQQYGTDNLPALGELIKQRPWLGAAFFISAISLVGFPPLSGFWAKLLVIKAALDAHWYISILFCVVVGLFTLYSMLKIWRYGFCEPATIKHDSKPSALSSSKYYWLTALLPLVIIPVVIGIWPDLLLHPLQAISQELQNPALYAQQLLGAS